MRTQSHEFQIKQFFFENEIVKNKVQNSIKHEITSTTHSITIGFHRHRPLEHEVKPINKSDNTVFHNTQK